MDFDVEGLVALMFAGIVLVLLLDRLMRVLMRGVFLGLFRNYI